MKNLLKLFGITLFLSSVALFTACGGDEEDDVKKPENLKATVSGLNVTLSWSGNADSYELRIDQEGTIEVAENLFTKEEMTEGAHTWQIRAKKGDKFSDWASSSFEIGARLLHSMEIERPSNNVAVFKWEGAADSYDLKLKIIKGTASVDEKTIENITAKTYRLENPQYTGASYKYFWEMRAKKGNEYTEWDADTVAFYMYEALPSDAKVTVEFKGREWTATNIIANLVTINAFGEQKDAMNIIAEEITDGFATVHFRFPLADIGTTVAIDSNFTYSQTEATYFEELAHEMTGYPYLLGDWIFLLVSIDGDDRIGEYKITSYDEAALKVSGELSIKLFSYDDYYGQQNPDDPRIESVKVKFENIKLEDYR